MPEFQASRSAFTDPRTVKRKQVRRRRAAQREVRDVVQVERYRADRQDVVLVRDRVVVDHEAPISILDLGDHASVLVELPEGRRRRVAEGVEGRRGRNQAVPPRVAARVRQRVRARERAAHVLDAQGLERRRVEAVPRRVVRAREQSAGPTPHRELRDAARRRRRRVQEVVREPVWNQTWDVAPATASARWR